MFVLFGMMILASLSAAVVETSFQRLNVARSMSERGRALEVAMTGLDLAVFELQKGYDIGGDGIGNSEGSMSGGDYRVTIDPAFGAGSSYRLSVLGEYGGSSQGIELVVASGGSLPFGLFGRTSLVMGGNASIDSYDASAGTYASQVVGTHAGNNGSMGSNSDIIASGGLVHGNATPGPAFQVLGDPTNVTGSTAPALEPYEFEEYNYNPSVASSGTYTGTHMLSNGSFRYDELKLVGNHTLTLSGDVDLYVDGSIAIGGNSQIVVLSGANVNVHHGSDTIKIAGTGIVNQSALPSNLTIFSATTDEVKVTGTSDFYGLLYAPDAEFRVQGTSNWFGAVIADRVSLTGTGDMHFDDSLQTPGSDSSFSVQSARPISTVGL